MFSIFFLLVFRVLEHDVMSMQLHSFIYNTNHCRGIAPPVAGAGPQSAARGRAVEKHPLRSPSSVPASGATRRNTLVDRF